MHFVGKRPFPLPLRRVPRALPLVGCGSLAVVPDLSARPLWWLANSSPASSLTPTTHLSRCPQSYSLRTQGEMMPQSSKTFSRAPPPIQSRLLSVRVQSPPEPRCLPSTSPASPPTPSPEASAFPSRRPFPLLNETIPHPTRLRSKAFPSSFHSTEIEHFILP